MDFYFELRGKINNAGKVQEMFAYAPKAMTNTVNQWFWSITKKYVGFKGKKPGSYVRWLERQQRKDRPGQWSKQAAGSFRGFVKSKRRIDGMTLVMGIPPNADSKFVQGLRGMSTGGFPIRTGKRMIVPITKNLAARGITGRFFQNFRAMISAKRFVTAERNGTIFYIDARALEAGASWDEATLYVGKRHVDIPGFNFQFEEKFMKRWPKEVEYGQKRIDRTIRAIETGRKKPK
jgi:hypothetical protein